MAALERYQRILSGIGIKRSTYAVIFEAVSSVVPGRAGDLCHSRRKAAGQPGVGGIGVGIAGQMRLMRLSICKAHISADKSAGSGCGLQRSSVDFCGFFIAFMSGLCYVLRKISFMKGSWSF